MPAAAFTSARITRAALAERVAGALDHGSVLLVAGAGYGKTTLLEDALALRGGPSAWAPLSDREREAGRLLVTLLAALDAELPGVGAPLLERLAAGAEPLAVAARLTAELDALLVDPVVLVVDDAERLVGATDAIAVLESVLRARPGRLRLAVATRRPLGLALAKARAAGHVGEVSEDDLAFSADECEQLLRLALRREPSDSEVAATMQSTLGWPLGVVLGAHGGDDPERALGAFLDEEVLARLDAATRAPVLDSAAVDVLTPGVLSALGLETDFPARVAATGLALVPAADRTGAFTYHPLVRELLRERWRRERTAAERCELMGRVAGPLAQAGRTAAAIEAWLDGERWDEALRAITARAPLMLGASPETVRAWLGRLPPDARRSPLARLLAAQLLLNSGRPAHAADELGEILPELGGADLGTQWSARLVLAECRYFSGRLDHVAELADGFDRPEVRVLGKVADAVALWAAMAHAACGRIESAERLARMLEAAGGEDAGVLSTWRHAFVRGPSGEVDELLDRIAQELDVADRDPHLSRPELLLPTSIWLLSARGGFAEALRLNDEHMRRVDELDVRADLAALAHVLHAWLLAHRGLQVEARAALDAAGPPPTAAWPAAVFEGTAALLAGATGEAAVAARAARRAIAHLAQAPTLLADIISFSLVPLIADVDLMEARAIVDARLARLAITHPDRGGRFHRGRLLAQRAWIRFAEEDDGWRRDVASALTHGDDMAAHVIGAEWARLREPALAAVADAGVAPRLLEALEAVRPGELLTLTEHPEPAVRARAAVAVARSGNVEAAVRLAALAEDPDPEVAAGARAAAERMRRTPPARVFTLLGGFRLRRGESTVDDRAWGRPMAQRLVRLLLVRRGEPVLEDDLFEAFWPGKPPGSARASLQVAVSRARAVLDPPGSEASSIRATGGGYELLLGDLDRVDADEFERAAAMALATRGQERRAALEAAERLWTGEPLPEDRYADWARPWRHRLEAVRREQLAALLDERLQAGALTAAAEAGLRALELDPVDERAHRALMVAYARAGRRGRALRQYLECRRALVDSLGIEPGEEAVALQRRILAGAVV